MTFSRFICKCLLGRHLVCVEASRQKSSGSSRSHHHTDWQSGHSCLLEQITRDFPCQEPSSFGDSRRSDAVTSALSPALRVLSLTSDQNTHEDRGPSLQHLHPAPRGRTAIIRA